MSNPQSVIPSAQLPYINTVIANNDGTPTLLFHRFITGLWQRTGGAAGVNPSDVQQIATQALTIAQEAQTEATSAQATATAAQTTANTAIGDAGTALTAASNALSLASSTAANALLKTQNLADLASVSTARSNLGVSTFPLTFAFDTPSASLKRGIPLTRNLTVPTSFAGTVGWWGVPSVNDTVFHVGYSTAPSSTITAIGTITVVHGGTGLMLSVQPSVTLVAGQTLVVTCPSVPDATLAQVSFTIPLTLA